ncbi:MAG: HAD-IIIC family phosphatase [Mobilitalea sp.]
MKITVLSNVNMDMLLQMLKSDYNVFNTQGYGQWIQYCLNENLELKSFDPNIIFVFLDGNELLKDCRDIEKGESILNKAITYITSLIKTYSNSIISISTIDIEMGIKVGNTRDYSISYMEYWDSKLSELSNIYNNVYRFELARLIRMTGSVNFYSDKLWYLGSIPYDIKSFQIIKREMMNFIKHLTYNRKKVLVLDLDNTIWGGIIGEDGVNGIELGISQKGAIYKDTQTKIKQLKETGVLLAIASKNNLEDVQAVFNENSQMVLKLDDFVAIYVNWEPKSENIKCMIKNLNLGIDSFVFLDDNIVEQEEVKLELPEVSVVNFPKEITKLPRLIEEIYDEYFWVWKTTYEDEFKTDMYHANKKREIEMKGAPTMDEFLLSLSIKINIAACNFELIDRVVQLINKTNQFNTCNMRLNKTEVIDYMNSKDKQIVVTNVSDKYGDMGLIAVLLLSFKDNIVFIDNFLMSCRVMSRKIEDDIINKIMGDFSKIGVNHVIAYYRPTTKNKPVEKLWDRLGFTLESETENEKCYSADCNEVNKRMFHNVDGGII